MLCLEIVLQTNHLMLFKCLNNLCIKVIYKFSIILLLQCPDLELKDLKDLIKDRQYVVLSSHWNKFEEQLLELYTNGVGSLLDLISSLSRLMTEPTVLMPIVNKSSIIGKYYLNYMSACKNLD